MSSSKPKSDGIMRTIRLLTSMMVLGLVICAAALVAVGLISDLISFVRILIFGS
jgi:hypothetical protein